MNTSASILVVDDHKDVLDYIERTLNREGYRVFKAQDGVEALSVLETVPIDMILADISMPRMNGYQLHARVTENPKWVTIPFVFLTAFGLDSDVRYGKELGVDDYVVKPFRYEDLLAIVRGRLRRAQQLAEARSNPRPDVLLVGRLRIDPAQHRVWANDKQIRLSGREFRLLCYLARYQNRVVPLEELVRETHELDTDRADAGSLLRPLIRSIRRKLGYSAGQMGCIESVRGIGYQLISSD